MTNRLTDESSPYLLQHVNNPVDWYPWCAEAFALASQRDKPVFVSIGYAACHWCHVMARECFENAEIASVMNDLFVNIKVDREERPDVDAVYMGAIQLMGQGGGWPLSAFCDSQGRPYFLGTYFPPTDRHGRPGFPKLLHTMSDVYRDQREKVAHNIEGVLDGLRQADAHFRRAKATSVGALDQEMLVRAGRSLVQSADPNYGGLGTKPKFPASPAHALLGRSSRLAFGEPSLEAFLHAARRMSRGGIYDHLGGGFSRYAVDERWLIPHFEKMLYDNGQLLGIVADAFALSGEQEYSDVICETTDWMLREMSDATGGLFASQDADSEGVEGKYYVWTPAQIRDVIGAMNAVLFSSAYGVTAHGNFEDKTTVLSRVEPRGEESDERALRTMRRKLFEARALRIAPDTDTKVLSGWNGLAIVGLLRAWQVTGYKPARNLAERVGAFLVTHMMDADGTHLARVFKNGEAKLDGTLDDYAFCAQAFLQLAESTGKRIWWQRGMQLVDVVLERFYDEQDGGVFYLTPKDNDSLLMHRPESHHDGALPAGSAVMVECLLRRSLVSCDEQALNIAERYLAARIPQAVESPVSAARLLAALDFYLHGSVIVITDGPGADALREAVVQGYYPNAVIAGPWAHGSINQGKINGADGRAQAYVCRSQSCSEPVSTAAELAKQLT